MQLNGAEIVIECLKEQGCRYCIRISGGGAILNVYDELYKHRDEIRHILTSHEQGAAHAADGYARATGKSGGLPCNKRTGRNKSCNRNRNRIYGFYTDCCNYM